MYIKSRYAIHTAGACDCPTEYVPRNCTALYWLAFDDEVNIIPYFLTSWLATLEREKIMSN